MVSNGQPHTITIEDHTIEMVHPEAGMPRAQRPRRRPIEVEAAAPVESVPASVADDRAVVVETEAT